MGLFGNLMMENCLDSMSNEEVERFFLKIAERIKPETHIKIFVKAFKSLPDGEKEKVRETLFGEDFARILKEWKELEKEYETAKKREIARKNSQIPA